jgi:hypothetical protein
LIIRGVATLATSKSSLVIRRKASESNLKIDGAGVAMVAKEGKLDRN